MALAPRHLDRLTLRELTSGVHPDDRARVSRKIQNAFDSGDEFKEEYRLANGGAAETWVYAQGRYLAGVADRPPVFQGVVLDITARKAAELALHEREEFARNVVESSPDCIQVLDLDGRLLSMNDAGCRHMEIDDFAALAFQPWTGFWPEPARAEASRAVSAARRGESARFEGVCLTAKGNPRSWEVSVNPIRDLQGQTVRMFSIARDVTEQKRAESALNEKARLATLGAEVGAALTRVVSLPEALRACAEAMVQYSGAAFAHIWTLVPDENVLELQASAGSYTHTNGPHPRVPIGKLKIGYVALKRQPYLTNNLADDPLISDADWARREGMVAFAGYPLLVEERLVGVLGFFARNALEKDTLGALASVASTLAIGIERKRTEDILLVQRRELERSNADLEQFAFAAAHDLQEPLRMVTIYAQLLSEKVNGTLDSDGCSFIGHVTGGAQRMSMLLQDLLIYAETSRHPELEPAVVDLNEVMAEVMMNLKATIEQNQAVITVGLLPKVRGHEKQFLQLFQNLIGNAIKYRSPAIPDIRVTAGLSQCEWIFRVEDNGMGINAEYQRHVFGVFKRLHDREIPSTGIGLAICQRIVDRNRGRIWVESAGEGRGSTFCFTHPAA